MGAPWAGSAAGGSAPDAGAAPPAEPPEPSALSRPAVASVVLGLLWIGGLGSALAVTFGIIGLQETTDPARHGRPTAWAGLVLGGAGLLATIGLVLVVSLGGARPLRPAPATDRCAVALGQVDAGYADFRSAHGLPPQSPDELGASGTPADALALYTIVADPVTGAGVLQRTPLGHALQCPVPPDHGEVATAPASSTPAGSAPARPTTTDLISGADLAACTADLSALQTAGQEYLLVHGQAPTSVAQLVASGDPSQWYRLGPGNGGDHFELVRTPAAAQVGCPAPPAG